ncbi:YifB family Mg chelatase-like AAA ATPase [Brevibacillus dissolubilis]|uniref:YifB family Mg chelatase-like AAA ATPase n=1 Tax=Brevibacillus dissolubilis TaxID=1844116 RepID=UPI001117A205|nr:YifB family Mg chelatase-like AAA ATPase [Brevibacillus dissolubilis]
MYARTFSGTVHGIDGITVAVEVDLANGLPQFDIVGLGGSAVKESRDRVRAALRNGGFEFPMKRITVNLAPADLRKEGSAFDLAIALGILLSSEQLPLRNERTMILGELALDGSLRPIPGVLPILLEAKKQGFTHALLPAGNAQEARLVELQVMPAHNLKEAVSYWKPAKENKDNGIDDCSDFTTNTPPTIHITNQPDPDAQYHPRADDLQPSSSAPFQPPHHSKYNFSDVIGQTFVKRGLEVAAAGFHNVLLVGPPGSGKTLLANCLPTIMPQMTRDESFEVTKIYSIAGYLTHRSGLIQERPIRSPHHTITSAALAGGGAQIPRPGECSLAHGGILFLDEIPEFSRHVIEVLRQPLEAGQITIGRAKQGYVFPAQFLLVGSMNPCPCGFYGTRAQQECTCSPQQIHRYRSRISGPILDRIDIHLEVPRVAVDLLGERQVEESSESIRERVERARLMQAERFQGRKGFCYNSGMTGSDLRKYVPIDRDGQELMKLAFEKMGLSARGYDRIIKVARTIADLQGTEQVESTHVAEAIRYRALDRGGVNGTYSY